ncbi:hypothetical protein FACS1894105_13290 [Clostridia bacterium]|nr:hypothetical protein FACS1894105_13290 [Clostridia bacterium]
MVENVIVTVVCDNREFDMELPAKAKFAQLRSVIAEALVRKGVRVSGGAKFTSNGYLLKDSDTLFDTGVWDGSYLTVV